MDQLSDKQVWELAEIILTADGGCTYCVPIMYADLLRVFPEYADRIRDDVLARCEEFSFDPANLER